MTLQTNKVEKLRANIAEALGRAFELRGFKAFSAIAYRKVDELIQAVRDEEKAKRKRKCKRGAS